MRYDCVVIKLKGTFVSLKCKFTAKGDKGGIVSRCRCNIFTIRSRCTGSSFCFSSIHKYFSSSPLKSAHSECAIWLSLMHCPYSKSIVSAHEYAGEYARLSLAKRNHCRIQYLSPAFL